MNAMPIQREEQSLPPVALVHGWGGSSYDRTWRGGTWLEGELLAQGRTLIPVALPGHSPGVTSDRPTDYAEIADQVWCTLERHAVSMLSDSRSVASCFCGLPPSTPPPVSGGW